MRRYFAYGSNMWNVQMQRRCPQSRKVGNACLKGYRWIIAARGYASVVPSPNDEVQGVLFEISPSDEDALDGFEGVGIGSYRKADLPVVFEGREVMALVYIDSSETEGPPVEEYIGRINAGVRDAQLSPAYVERYIRRFVPAE